MDGNFLNTERELQFAIRKQRRTEVRVPIFICMDKLKGWHSRGYLPHFDGGEITQFITFRLHDSLPQNVLQALENQKSAEIDNLEIQRRIEKYLDCNYGECYLKNPNIAEIVQRKLLAMNDNEFRLKAWVIMPNHVHLLLTPCAGKSLSPIMQSIKGATAREANLLLKRRGEFWMRDYFDRFIRDYEHFIKAFDYIINNPVKAGLCAHYSDWQFSSAWKEREL